MNTLYPNEILERLPFILHDLETCEDCHECTALWRVTWETLGTEAQDWRVCAADLSTVIDRARCDTAVDAPIHIERIAYQLDQQPSALTIGAAA
jgi:hypothetical protein